MRIKSADLRRGAFGQPSVPILLSRRAHLFTTPKGRWYFLRKPCALRGGCGSCGSLMDNAASHHCPRSRLNVLLRMHNKGMAICHPLSRLPAINLPPTVLSQLWVSLMRHPFSFCEKETKTENERTVRTDGNLSLGSKGGQQRFGAICGCRFRLFELYQYLKRL